MKVNSLENIITENIITENIITENIITENIITENIITIKGFVEIRNGNNIIKANNKFVQTLLQYITNYLSSYYNNPDNNSGRSVQGPMVSYTMYLGTDTGTPTYYNTTVLTTPIGTTPGTVPDSITGSTSNPSSGVFQIIITAIWNAGTLPGNPTVGEMALYLWIHPAGNLKPFGWTDSGSFNPTVRTLGSRLAVADGAFSPFTINSANPLSIVWTIQFSFV